MLRQFVKIAFLILSSSRLCAQHDDTLEVMVMSPYQVIVDSSFADDYNKIKTELQSSRRFLKESKLKERSENEALYEQQASYIQKMLDNKLAFYDSITINNYVSAMACDYIAYRLYRPFKVKVRYVHVTAMSCPSDSNRYASIAGNKHNFFIVNIPAMLFYKEKSELRVKTSIEVYDAKQNAVIYKQEDIGNIEGGLTDYPMCTDKNWDCALVNSVYPSLFKIVKLIASSQQDK